MYAGTRANFKNILLSERSRTQNNIEGFYLYKILEGSEFMLTKIRAVVAYEGIW